LLLTLRLTPTLRDQLVSQADAFGHILAQDGASTLKCLRYGTYPQFAIVHIDENGVTVVIPSSRRIAAGITGLPPSTILTLCASICTNPAALTCPTALYRRATSDASVQGGIDARLVTEISFINNGAAT
jgi:hypothetical protein